LHFYREIVDSIVDYVLVIDRDYRIVYANRSLLERCGRTEGEVIGKRCHEFSHHCPVPCRRENATVRCAHEEVFDTGRSTSVTQPINYLTAQS